MKALAAGAGRGVSARKKNFDGGKNKKKANCGARDEPGLVPGGKQTGLGKPFPDKNGGVERAR